MRPSFLLIKGSSAFVRAKVPMKFTSSVSRIMSISVFSLSTLMSPGMPALFTSSDSSGNRSPISLAALPMPLRSLSSIFTQPSTSTPAFSNSPMAFSALCPSRAPTITFQPLMPRCLTIPKPMPLLAPVTKTILSFILHFIINELLYPPPHHRES